MGEVVQLQKHKLHGGWCCAGGEDIQVGSRDWAWKPCFICDGGLSVCVVCGGGEGSLPTDCPGVVQTPLQTQLIMAGRLDYLANYGWVLDGEQLITVPGA